jgi:hypothetical protein
MQHAQEGGEQEAYVRAAVVYRVAGGPAAAHPAEYPYAVATASSAWMNTDAHSENFISLMLCSTLPVAASRICIGMQTPARCTS